MRKITQFLMLCAFFLGLCANAQQTETVTVYKPTKRVAELKTDGTKYMIFNAVNYPGMYGARYGFVSNNGSGLNKPKVKPSEMEALSDAHLFTLEVSTNANAYYIKSVSTNKYVNHEGNTNNADPQDCYIYKWTETPATKGGFASVMSKDDESVMLATADITDAECLFSISNASTTNENGVTTWRGWNGNEGSFTAWSNVHPYAFYEVSETQESVTTTMIEELTSLSNDKVYIIKNARTANTALVHKAGESNVVWNGKETAIQYDPRSNNFHWAIYKSSNNNYYLYNVGAGKYMGSAMAKDAAIPFVDASGLHSVVIEKSSTNANYPFVMSTNNEKGALNTSGNHAQGAINWRDGYSKTNDAGNQFAFYEVADISEELLSTIQTAVAAYEANGVANWKALYADVFGYVGGYPLNLQETFNAIETEEAKDNFLYDNNTIDFSANTYYRLVCVAPKTGNGGDVNYNTLTFNGASNLVTAPMNMANANQIFVFENKAETSNYKLKSLNANAYLNTINLGTYRAQTVTDENEIGEIQLRNVAIAQYELNKPGGWCLFAENHPTETVPYGCAGWSNGANSASAWYLIPATELDINMVVAQGGAYTSIYLPFAVTLDEGTKAYAGKVSDTKDVLNMTEVGNVIPAETPVVLVSDNADEHTLTIGGTADAVADNDLEGTLTPIVFTDNKAEYLIFGIAASEKAGFYTSAGTQISANKAYLPASLVATAQTVKMNFGGEATGIEAIEKADNAKAPIYDLSGRRVVNTAKGGIYIQNGRKFIVK